MRRIDLPILIVLCIVIYSCKDNVICPAFQSTYILNDSIRLAKYSYFSSDSVPKFALASRRTKYGISKKTSLFQKNYELKTAPKVNVLGLPKIDTTTFIQEGIFVVADFVDIDSLGTDSTAINPLLATAESEGPKYKYRYDPKGANNYEQVYYNKYYGELFIDNRPKESSPDKLAEEELQNAVADTAIVKKKFGLFKKKKIQDEPEVEKEPERKPELVEELTPEEGSGN